MKKRFPLAGLFLVVLALSYLESPYSLINKEHARVADIPNEVLLAEDQEKNSEEEIEAEAEEVSGTDMDEVAPLNFTVETVLEKRSKEGDYIVEIYREYEYYRDENGKVIEKVPTENIYALRYYDQ